MTTWDEPKRRANLAKHGWDFAQLSGFDWFRADIEEDRRSSYGEQREMATSWIGISLVVYTYTLRDGDDRAISLRKATPSEFRRYARGQ